MKKLIALISIFASTWQAHGAYVCRTSCSGEVDRIIDQAIIRYKGEVEKFQSACQSQGGTFINGNVYTSDSFDKMGCYVGTSDFGPKISYCTVKDQVEATGYGATTISKEGGGLFTASSDARESCGKNLHRFNCSGQLDARKIVYTNPECREL
jgi:hypothetical protein